jgi:malonyl-CoA/methylmalonyl-CoA synthetase
MNENLYARLAAAFEPERPFLTDGSGARYTYADLEKLSGQAAQALRDLGLEAGDRVSVVAEKSVEYLWLYLGCLRAGLIFHPLNPAYTARELGFFLRDAGSRALVFDPGLGDRLTESTAACPELEFQLTLDARGEGSFADVRRQASILQGAHENRGDDQAALLYSSGTTGTPKGICITHGNLFSNAVALADAWGFTCDDILLHALPVFHVHGLFITLGPTLVAGASLRFLSKFEPDAVLDALPGASLMAGVPTYYTRLLADTRLDQARCASLRLFISGSAPLSEATFHAFAERTGHIILERYGMTETGINTSNPLQGTRKAGSVGPPLQGVELRVVAEDGSIQSDGMVGDIEVRGPNVLPGYWRLPEATEGAFRDGGWFATGDQGYLDEDGYLFIVGRSKDMVISGGLNVYPKEIERELEACAGIAEAAVFGVPHNDFGEAVVAAVLSASSIELDEAALISVLKAQLAGFKVPKRILVLDELPRNAMGKVQKNLLRERYSALFS